MINVIFSGERPAIDWANIGLQEKHALISAEGIVLYLDLWRQRRAINHCFNRLACGDVVPDNFVFRQSGIEVPVVHPVDAGDLFFKEGWSCSKIFDCDSRLSIGYTGRENIQSEIGENFFH